jgi:hypothetical protein
MSSFSIYELTDVLPYLFNGIISYADSKKPNATSNNNSRGKSEKNKDGKIPSWVVELHNIGNWGENIAEKFLTTKYGAVKRVSDSNYIGYDFEAGGQLFEVKTTTTNKGVNFIISTNEIAVAEQNQETYHLLYILVDRQNETATGYIFDRLKSLGLRREYFEGIWSVDDFDSEIRLRVGSVKVEADADFLRNYNSYDLTPYLYEVLQE